MKMRFLGELTRVNVIDAAELVQLYTSFLAPINDVSDAKLERLDTFVSLVIGSLAWTGPVLVDSHPVDLDNIIAKIEQYLLHDTRRQARVKAIQETCRPIPNHPTPFSQEDLLTLQWHQLIGHARSVGWKNLTSQYIGRVHDRFPDDWSNGTTVLFGPISLPLDSAALTYSLPRINFEILHPDFLAKGGRMQPNLPRSTLTTTPTQQEHAADSQQVFDRYVLYDLLEDLVLVFESNHGEFVSYYAQVFFNADHQDQSTMTTTTRRYDPHQALMEILFGFLCALPQNSTGIKPAYFSTLLFSLCSSPQYPHFSKEFPLVLGKAMYTMFEHVGEWDEEVRQRLARWMAHHLANFEFRWNWRAWVGQVESSTQSTGAGAGEVEEGMEGVIEQTTPESGSAKEKEEFIKMVLDACIRLSYYERVQSTLPQDMDVTRYMPQQPEPTFQYISDSNTSASNNTAVIPGGGLPEPPTSNAGSIEEDQRAAASELLEHIRTRDTAAIEASIPTLCSVGARSGFGQCDGEEPGMDFARLVVVECVMLVGSKSISHLVNVIERTLGVLKTSSGGGTNGKNEEAMVKVLRRVGRVWHKNHLFLEIVLDKLVEYDVVSFAAVINWIFESYCSNTDGTENNSAEARVVSKTLFWGVLKGSMDRLRSRIKSLASRLKQILETSTGNDMSDDVQPDEVQDMIDRLKREQKQLLISTYQFFIQTLSSNDAGSGSAEAEEKKRFLKEMFVAVGRYFHQEIKECATTLDMLVFANAQGDYREIFQRVRQVRA